MNLPSTRPFVTPSLKGLLDRALEQARSDLYVARPGVLLSYDPSTSMATVKLVGQMGTMGQTGTEWYDLPDLVEVPVMQVYGGGGRLTFPMAPGDEGLVVFCDRNITEWKQRGSVGVPPTDSRKHDLSDGMFILGAWSKVRGADIPMDGVNLKAKEGAEVMLNDKAQMKTPDAEVTVSDKVLVKNQATTLNAVLTELLTALKSWVDTRGDAPNPGTVAALEAVQAKVNQLLEVS